MRTLRPRILARLARADATRTALLERLDALDPAWLSARPIEGKWSILEIVEHLVLAEEGFVRGMEASAGRPPLRRAPRHHVAYQVVMFVLRFDIPVRVPGAAMLPVGTGGLAGLRSRWDGTQRWLRATIEAMDDVALKRPAVRHPVAGPMTPRQAVAMLDVHLRRHVRQIRRRERLLAGRDGVRADRAPSLLAP